MHAVFMMNDYSDQLRQQQRSYTYFCFCSSTSSSLRFKACSSRSFFDKNLGCSIKERSATSNTPSTGQRRSQAFYELLCTSCKADVSHCLSAPAVLPLIAKQCMMIGLSEQVATYLSQHRLLLLLLPQKLLKGERLDLLGRS